MSIVTVATLIDTIGHNHLLMPDQIEQLTESLQPRFSEPRSLARELIQRDWMTPFQINQVFQGRGSDLVLGPYILLERLGEGGMGKVFKARNRKLGLTVALKVIRKERLTNPDAVRRFRREMRAAAQMSHPNVVRAFDADELDGTCYLAMEYMNGTDLGRLVKQNGPLSVLQACDYIRQAALGLQHIFERGLVHRDIKPSNLFMVRDQGPVATKETEIPGSFLATGHWPLATVKILDLGLARLQLGPANASSSSRLTKERTVMGTPDYIAPEQARDSRAADIRSDLYSLGCTFYWALTGQLPFPGETPVQKLLKRWCEEPVPVEQLRPEVPSAVAAVVRKLMAKAPEERYQTPAELVIALGAALRSPATPSGADGGEALAGSMPQISTQSASAGSSDTLEGAAIRPDLRTPFEFSLDEVAASTPSARPYRKCPDWNWIMLNAAGALLLMVLAALFLALLWR